MKSLDLSRICEHKSMYLFEHSIDQKGVTYNNIVLDVVIHKEVRKGETCNQTS
jgi:hypothetical protein